jgi:hypothetical protein
LVEKFILIKSSKFLEVNLYDLDFMDILPKLIISIFAGLISFLKYDDIILLLKRANSQVRKYNY